MVVIDASKGVGMYGTIKGKPHTGRKMLPLKIQKVYNTGLRQPYTKSTSCHIYIAFHRTHTRNYKKRRLLKNSDEQIAQAHADAANIPMQDILRHILLDV